MRLLASKVSSYDEAKALTHRNDINWIYCCSWGPSDDGSTLEGPDTIVLRAILDGILYGRNGLGSIFIFAAGNGGHLDNCNMDGFANSPFTITIGAITRKDQSPPYMESCAAMLAVTYSNDETTSIATCDTSNTCTLRHSGTSAAAPLAAGIYALLLSTRPDLTWRDVQALTIESSMSCSPSHGSWSRNGIGKMFSHRFAYGKMDANRLIQNAKKWKRLGPPVILPMLTKTFNNQSIPYDLYGIRSKMTVTNEMIRNNLQERASLYEDFSLEHVTVKLNIRHERRGDLKIYLKSPSGTLTELLTMRPRDILVIPIPSELVNSKNMPSNGNPYLRILKSGEFIHGNEWEFDSLSGNGIKDWIMMSVAFWGESSIGSWELQVLDMEVPEVQGNMIDWTLYLWGECKTSKSFMNIENWPHDKTLFNKEEYLYQVFQTYFPNSPIVDQLSIPTKEQYTTAYMPLLNDSTSSLEFGMEELQLETSTRIVLILSLLFIALLLLIVSIRYKRPKIEPNQDDSLLLNSIDIDIDMRTHRSFGSLFRSIFHKNSYKPIDLNLRPM